MAHQIPRETEFSRIVQQYTQADDKIIAYSFVNYEYIAANRLPASGNFFYLPWQKAYNENPVLGIKIDACEDIANYRPKVMLINKWLVWGVYPWESYGGCIQQILDEQYIKWPNRPYYIRKDLLPDGLLNTESR